MGLSSPPWERFPAFLDAMAARDVERAGALFHPAVHGFGTGSDEVVLDRESALALLGRESEQVPQKTRVEPELLLERRLSADLRVIRASVTHEVEIEGRTETFGTVGRPGGAASGATRGAEYLYRAKRAGKGRVVAG